MMPVKPHGLFVFGDLDDAQRVRLEQMAEQLQALVPARDQLVVCGVPWGARRKHLGLDELPRDFGSVDVPRLCRHEQVMQSH